MKHFNDNKKQQHNIFRLNFNFNAYVTWDFCDLYDLCLIELFYNFILIWILLISISFGILLEPERCQFHLAFFKINIY